MAGRGGMGEGDRPARPGKAVAERAGDPAACEPENEDLLEPGLGAARGGFMAVELDAGPGVEGTEALGVMGAPPMGIDTLGISVYSEADVMTEPVSDVVDARLTIDGREDEGTDGVRE